MDPELGANCDGAEVTRLGAITFGAEVNYILPGRTDAVRGVGARDLGAELGANSPGAELADLGI